MIVNRIREWRQRRGLSLDDLAAKVGTTRTTMQRLEVQPDAALHNLLEPLAQALGVRFAELFTEAEPDGLPFALPNQSAAPFDPPKGHDLHGLRLGPDQAMFVLLTDDLAEIGIYRGDVAIVDAAAESLAQVATGDAVIALLVDENRAQIFIARQFVAPHLLVANGPAPSPAPLHVVRDQVKIVGVIRRRFGDLRHKSTP